MITQLKENEVFVFGSNLNGEHLGGAAKQAYQQFGAIWGVGEGLVGQSYAFPTLDKEMKQLDEESLISKIRCLLDCCNLHPEKNFYLTRVGCGIAGFKDEYINGLFNKFTLPINLILPEEWMQSLKEVINIINSHR